MNTFRAIWASGVATLGLVAPLTMGSSAQGSSGGAIADSPSQSPAAQRASAPLLASSGFLFGVSVLSATDAWAAGSQPTGTMIKHWNGSQWLTSPSPNPGGTRSTLSDIRATSATDAWAVGRYFDGVRTRFLTEHWNGTAWSQVPSPNPLTQDNSLVGVDSVSSSNAWAVGSVDGDARTAIQRWNGAQWSLVPSPSPGIHHNTLADVSASSATDAWAVGYFTDGSYIPKPLVEHWNGTSWTVVPSPAFPGARSTQLTGVAALSPTDVWAVGYSERVLANGSWTDKTVIMHWNGTQWKQYPASTGALFAVSASSPTDAWAVGRGGRATHWDGTAWTAVKPDLHPGYNNNLFDVSVLSTTEAWTVGARTSENRVMADHWNGTSWIAS